MKHLLISIIILSMAFQLRAERTMINFNDDWTFRFSHNVTQKVGVRVNLPHTWNAQDALSGKPDYKRGIGNYEKSIFVPNEWKGKRIFIRFEGANTITNLLVNGKYVGEHRGGYTAFVFELTNTLKYGVNNTLWVRVNNAEQLEVMPLVGDFNFYGGIYRDVYLMLTDDICISPLDYASPGVYLKQEKVSATEALVQARILLSNQSVSKKNVILQLKVKQDNKTIIQENKVLVINPDNKDIDVTFPLNFKNPTLWNGESSPFMYQVEVSLVIDNKETDKVVQPLGLRTYSVDATKGFVLNGKPYQLKGVCRHQDRAEIGNALTKSQHDEDMGLMLEMGVNAIRLPHYPHAPYFYDLLDQYGFVAWSEIPFVGPGGYTDQGFINQESFKANGREQLKEMIRQNYNHPSICFWGLFNELKEVGDSPFDYITELNKLAHTEDPTRITTSASNIEGNINKITDLIAWNRYDGWYEGMPDCLGTWLDKTHKENPGFKIGISEYGAGASIYQQQDSLKKSSPTSPWHPENWQTYYHIENWKVLSQRPYLWGTFIWNMFDFGAAHRNEGDRPGINDKGLVTFDRKNKKDAFYFYKANWNTKQPTLHICDTRNLRRTGSVVKVLVFSNSGNTELFVNGVSMGVKSPDKFSTIAWQGINLSTGKNRIVVKATVNGREITDACEWNVGDNQVKLLNNKYFTISSTN
ncbi:MAG: glycoside hydrolase family 2 TIM barrel-domain containing protein [Paludibacter sp.]